MFRKPDSDPRLPDALPRQGDASTLLDFVIAHHAIRTQTVDLLADAIAQRDDGPEIGYQFLPQVRDFLKFSHNDKGGKNIDGKLFVLVHPEQKNARLTSIVTHENDDELIGRSYSLFNPLAVNFMLLHGEGYSEQVWRRFDKMRGIHWVGSGRALDLMVDGNRIAPKISRSGSGKGDASIVASLPIRNIIHRGTASGYRGRDTIVDANWPKGWQVYGLTGVFSERLPQERSIELEQKPMTPDGIRKEISALTCFLESDRHQLSEFMYGSSMNFRGHEIRNKIDGLRLGIAKQEKIIARLEQSLQNPSLYITPADLGIQIWK